MRFGIGINSNSLKLKNPGAARPGFLCPKVLSYYCRINGICVLVPS